MQAFPDRQLRVFLLDDHDLVRRGLRDLVSAGRDITVVGESSYARNAVDLILRQQPDVMVLDLHLQDGNGLFVCREVRAADPAIAGLLLTAAAEDEAALATLLGGAAGYTTKDARGADLIGMIRAIGARRPVIDGALRQQVVARFFESLDGLRPLPDDVTRRATELALEGHTDTDIARLLDIDVESVRRRLVDVISRTTGLRPEPDPVDDQVGRHRRNVL